MVHSPSKHPLLSLRTVSRAYASGTGVVHALHGVDLRIDHGELVAIVGPSGSGKSTCLNLVGCLDSPTSGVLEIEGLPVAALSQEQRAALRRDLIGFIFQGANLMPGMSALRNVELPLIYRGVSRIERRKRAALALTAVGLAHRLHHTPSQLSGGQQQRVAIARAIVSKPRLLIADEPTGALDSRTGAQIIQLLNELNRREGMAVVIVTHDRSVADIAPRIITFRDGRVVADQIRARSAHVA
ncbi:MAG: ABC transporter ATP-binding protein [Hyphomicrobiaceae bacterium]